MQIDTSTTFGRRVERRLREERIGWLTTVSPKGKPQPVPVWFLWQGDSILLYSQPDTPKLRNIARNAIVSLNLDSNGQGGDIVVLTGTAEVVESEPAAHEVPDYVAKYGEAMQRIGGSLDGFSRIYSVPLRFRPTSLRGH